jgi:hypothetical protein
LIQKRRQSKGDDEVKKILALLAISILAVLCVAGQAQERQLFRVSVPFSFTVQETVLPPGTYNVYVLNPFNMVRIMSTDGRHVGTISCISAGRLSEAQLDGAIFKRIGGQYFLTELRERGSGMERDFPLGSHAQALAKNPDRVVISSR